jgi:glycosyltransferase involved in cell wall biosynthesis
MKKYSISFVIPMYNEADNIEETLGRVTAFSRAVADDYEVIVADDASKDAGAAIVRRIAAADARVKLITLAKNTKFGGALAAGLSAASKDIVIYTDSDLPVKEEDIRKGLALLERCDIVTGCSMAIKDAAIKRIIMSKVYNFLVQLLFGLRIKDINSGFKIYRRDAIKDLDLISKSPFVDVEIFAEAARKGFKIEQFGLIFELRTHGVSTISRPGVVARTFYDMLRYRLLRARR